MATIHEPVTLASCGINVDAWNGMLDWGKSIIEAATCYENDPLTTEFDTNIVRTLDRPINEHGGQFKRMPDEVTALSCR